LKQAEKATFATVALFAAVVLTVNAGPRPAGHTRKPKAAAVPLTLGDLVTVGGVTYQVQLLPTLIPTGTPIPTPIPTPAPKPALTGIRNRATGLLVTSAVAGTPLQIEGVLLGTGAGRVQLAGRIAAQPTSWTGAAIQFLAPDPGGVAITGGWDVYQPSGATFLRIASSGSFTLLPGTAPVPTPTPTPTPTPLPPPGTSSLMVTGFREAMGQLAQSFAPGDTIFIQGQGFGAVTGQVMIGVKAVPVLVWTPTEIQVRCPALDAAAQTMALMLTVTHADGKQYERLKGFTIMGVPGRRKP